MEIKLYNTLTRKIEEFKPVKPPEVSMYTCGMTVYDHTTIGHMKTYINTDFLRRTLEYLGYKIKMVENVTDVGHLVSDGDFGEDKLQLKARKEAKSAWEIAREFEQEFYETMDRLNVLRPTIIARATDNIKEMVELVQDLEKKGFTYIIAEDGVYFDTSKFPEYGQIAGIDESKLKAGARVEMVKGKKNLTDFALWKFSPKDKVRDMEWDSPWGRGFPGWHIECSVMSMKYLTTAFESGHYQPEKFETIDLHTGGEDHITIHHPNEIAQTEASTGKRFANYWSHNRFLMIEGQKMSKSLGNFYTLKDVVDHGFSPLALRYLFATAHYLQRINFTWGSLEAAQKALNRLYEIAREVSSSFAEAREDKKVLDWKQRFSEAIADDLGMPQALALVWEMVKSDLPDSDKYALLLDWDRVLGLDIERNAVMQREVEIPDEILKLAEEREKMRKEKLFAEADELRKKIEAAGFTIEDTSAGPKLKKTS
jgi:cysteinyl-tRNA synthetase